jgi:hypothetical protein
MQAMAQQQMQNQALLGGGLRAVHTPQMQYAQQMQALQQAHAQRLQEMQQAMQQMPPQQAMMQRAPAPPKMGQARLAQQLQNNPRVQQMMQQARSGMGGSGGLGQFMGRLRGGSMQAQPIGAPQPVPEGLAKPAGMKSGGKIKPPMAKAGAAKAAAKPGKEEVMKGSEMKKPMKKMASGGCAKPMKKMASGGYVRGADGIAKKGKTRGKVC